MKNLLACSLFLLIASLAHGRQPAPASLPKLGKSPLSEILRALTLEEKTKLVVGMGFRMPNAPRRDTGTRRQDTARSPEGFRLPPGDPAAAQIPEKVPGAAGRTRAIDRLGIPSITVSDGPAGLRISPFRNGDSSRSYYATAFPVATLLASSWDTALVQEVGRAFGSEIREYGVDLLLAPGLNIHRNPLGGRNFEYYSEDPVVTGWIASAIVSGIQSMGVGTSIKHFAANNQETNRNTINTIVGERTLREIYLKGFEIAVKHAHPWTVMSSYNKINGLYTSESEDLLTGILRNEWGYKGLVMTDWFGGSDPIAQMKAGNDLLMPGNPNQSKAIQDAVTNGSLDPALLDRNVERVLNLVLQSPEFKKYQYSNKPNLEKDAVVSRRAAAEGMVLLKNEGNALPLKHAGRFALLGNTSYDVIAGGTGSGDVNKAYTVSISEGLEKAGLQADEELKNSYSRYLEDAKSKRPKQRNMFQLPPPIAEMTVSKELLAQEAAKADVAIITIGRNAGEGADRKLENDFYLSGTEKELLQNTATAFHAKNKKIIIILNIGGVIEVASWRQWADAILLAWQPGQEAGNAIADIIFGKVNPSGKLATTFPIDYKDVPSGKNFPGKELVDTSKIRPAGMRGKPSEVVYEEGIYVGYRYYQTFQVKPAYEFGYGRSYTQFAYGPLKLSSTQFKGSVDVSIIVTNTGKVPGKEVVELYLHAPAGKMDKPEMELKAFGKTALLQPGKTQSLRFRLSAQDLASFDTKSSSWIAESGKYQVMAGSSSLQISPKAFFELKKDLVTEKDSPKLVPKQPIQELSRPASSASIVELNNFVITTR